LDFRQERGRGVKSLRALYHLARADFLQRTRSYGFLITLGITLYVGCFFIPPNHSSYATMTIGDHRGLYNSAYLGSLMALLISPVIGFCCAAALSVAAVPVREVSGVSMPEVASGDNKELRLNGMGLRTKFFIKIYVAGLYLGHKEKDAAKILAEFRAELKKVAAGQ
jgi:hypothetical protein